MNGTATLRLAVALAMVVVVAGCIGTTPLSGPVAPVKAPQVSLVDQFDILWQRFDEVYPSFEYKGVDWPAQRERYRARAESALSQDALVTVLLSMLAPLQDRHVWLVDPRGQIVPSYKGMLLLNFDEQRWRSAMITHGIEPDDDLAVGTIDSFAYLQMGSWPSPGASEVLDSALLAHRNAPGLILDLRRNAGGNDVIALGFAGRFTRQSFPASYVEIRTDPLVSEIEMPLARMLSPKGEFQYTRPVVLITGRGSLSATETFVAAMRTLKQVTVIGDTTGGASGNPATYQLGNGWKFTVPRWLAYGPDLEPIEGRGLAPGIAIPWRPADYPEDQDPLIDAALDILFEKTGTIRTVAPSSPNDR